MNLLLKKRPTKYVLYKRKYYDKWTQLLLGIVRYFDYLKYNNLFVTYKIYLLELFEFHYNGNDCFMKIKTMYYLLI